MQRTGNIHNNLYEKGTQQKLNKNRKINVGDEETKEEKPLLNKLWTFQPKISKMSMKIIANGKIEDRLLQDARKRISAKMAREEAKKLEILKVCQIQNMEQKLKIMHIKDLWMSMMRYY